MRGRFLMLMVMLLLSPLAKGGDFPKGQPPVYVFTQDFCPACLGAEQYMKAQGIRYHDFNIDENEAALKMFRKLGARGTPLFIIGHTRMMGFDPHRFETLFDRVKDTMRSSD